MAIVTAFTVSSFSIGVLTGWFLYKSHARKVWLRSLAKILDLQNKPHNNVIRLVSKKKP